MFHALRTCEISLGFLAATHQKSQLRRNKKKPSEALWSIEGSTPRRSPLASSFLPPFSAPLVHEETDSPSTLLSVRAFFGRLGAAIATSRRLKAEQEVARFLEANGGRLTDNMEREISRRFGAHIG